MKHEVSYMMRLVEGGGVTLAAFAASVSIMYVYSLMVDDAGATDWEWCLRYSLVLGIVVPCVRRTRKNLTRLVKYGHLLS